MPLPSPPASPGRSAVLRKKSSSLAEQRDELHKHVQQEALARHSQLARLTSAYLPRTTSRGDSADGGVDLRITAGAIQTIYTIHQRYERRRIVDNIAFIVAMMGVLLVFMDNEYAASSDTKLVVRSLNAGLTLLLLALVVWRFVLEREILVMRNVLPPHVSVFRLPRQLLVLVVELLVCAVCVPPGVDGRFTVWEWKYYMDSRVTTGCVAPFHADRGSCYMAYSYPYEVLGLFALLRLYMLPRVVLNLSEFTSYRTSYLGALHHVDTQSSLFAVKCFLHAHPFKVLLAGFGTTLFLTSYALSIVEAPVNPALVPLANAMWLVVLTMGTIGYGDVNAVTIAGQLLLVLGGMLMGILLFGVLSSAMFSFLSLDERDRRFLFLLRRQEHQKRLKTACALSIQAAWRCARARDSGTGSLLPTRLQHNRLQDVLFACLADQRRVRREVVEDFRSITTELQRCQDQVLASLKEDHAATMQRLQRVEERLDALVAAATAKVSAAA